MVNFKIGLGSNQGISTNSSCMNSFYVFSDDEINICIRNYNLQVSEYHRNYTRNDESVNQTQQRETKPTFKTTATQTMTCSLEDRISNLEFIINTLVSKLQGSAISFNPQINSTEITQESTPLRDVPNISTYNHFEALEIEENNDLTINEDQPQVNTAVQNLNTSYANVQPEFHPTVIPHQVFNKETLIIGDSMLKHIKTRGLWNASVKTLRGYTVQQVSSALKELDVSQVKNVIVHAGTNDCSNLNYNKEELMKDYNELISSLKPRISGKVFLSGICPRLDDPHINVRVLETNEELKSRYKDDFIDNSKAFLCRYGLDASKFVYHGLHLNKYGTFALIKSLNSKIQIIRPKRNNLQESSSTYCYFCAESGHTRRVCHHGQPVTCWSCNSVGHKSKFCEIQQ
ncbi:uncharacterized protein LOC117114252 [Anneissia japonica]|uniref:uncharacterized protein LOC117114252 n=1 Tax=Anneissia japonica TaxID=1529436 RepID=UPI001425544B|nr:uncharacterized protein LOC117114252 [Anneissia japonica]